MSRCKVEVKRKKWKKDSYFEQHFVILFNPLTSLVKEIIMSYITYIKPRQGSLIHNPSLFPNSQSKKHRI